jgi:hypothetical protein
VGISPVRVDEETAAHERGVLAYPPDDPSRAVKGDLLMSSRLARVLLWLPLAASLLAPTARAELAAWDQAKVAALATDLKTASDSLYDAFLQQPTPNLGSMQSNGYYRLKQLVRMLRSEAGVFARSLAKGEGREQTAWIYETLMSLARSARDEAGRVFVATDLSERAAAVRGVLNRLGPYYDPDFQRLAPHPNIEPRASR